MVNDPIPTPNIDDKDPLAEESDTVFQRREILRPQFVPDGNRIVGRDNEISEVEELLRPAAQGDPPGNGFLFGETGTGKSLVAKHVTGRARAVAQSNDIEFVAAYVDCDQYNTETRVAREIAYQVQKTIDPDRHIPGKGIGASEYYDHLWGRTGLLDRVNSFVVILDEIDMLGEKAVPVLSKLSRSEEAGKTSCYIGVIAISNKTDYTKEDDERVSSSFQDEPIVFPPYDANQLKEILERRRDAFKDGALEDGAVALTAAFAARDYGDARQALDIMRTAGKFADKDESSVVTEEHVEKADDFVDLNRSIKLIKQSTTHKRYVLFAVAYLSSQSSRDEFSTGEIYDVYKVIAQVLAGGELTHQRVLELLKEWAQPDITEHRHTSRGRGRGTGRFHRLLHDPGIVMEASIPDDAYRTDALDALD